MTQLPEAEPAAANSVDWRLRLQEIDHPLAGQLHENPDPYAVVEKLGMRVPSFVRFSSVDALLADPSGGLAPLARRGIQHYYVGLRPYQPDLSKFRNEAPLPLDGVVPYIAEHVPAGQEAAYSLRVAEYVVAVCGMVIIVNPSGQTHVDMAMGDLGPLATGRQRPKYQARTDPYTGILRYRCVNDGGGQPTTKWATDREQQLPENHPEVTPQLRTAIAAALRQIPCTQEGFRPMREPGRYEAAIVDHGGLLVPVFVDAQPDFLTSRIQHPYALPEISLT